VVRSPRRPRRRRGRGAGRRALGRQAGRSGCSVTDKSIARSARVDPSIPRPGHGRRGTASSGAQTLNDWSNPASWVSGRACATVGKGLNSFRSGERPLHEPARRDRRPMASASACRSSRQGRIAHCSPMTRSRPPNRESHGPVPVLRVRPQLGRRGEFSRGPSRASLARWATIRRAARARSMPRSLQPQAGSGSISRPATRAHRTRTDSGCSPHDPPATLLEGPICGRAASR